MLRKVTNMNASQTPRAEIGAYSSAPHPCALIEISEPVVKKLSQICAEQNIPIKELVSTLLQRMLLEHRKETKQIAEKFKCRGF